MSSERPTLEIADILRRHGAAFRAAHAGHLSLQQLKVMTAIEACRTAALGGHVEGCQDCGHCRIAYNSCRNRHCPKCQAAAARDWLERACKTLGYDRNGDNLRLWLGALEPDGETGLAFEAGCRTGIWCRV